MGTRLRASTCSVAALASLKNRLAEYSAPSKEISVDKRPLQQNDRLVVEIYTPVLEMKCYNRQALVTNLLWDKPCQGGDAERPAHGDNKNFKIGHGQI